MAPKNKNLAIDISHINGYINVEYQVKFDSLAVPAVTADFEADYNFDETKRFSTYCTVRKTVLCDSVMVQFQIYMRMSI